MFVWALIFSVLRWCRAMYQHRVLFWGIFGALVLRAIFIFAGVALIESVRLDPLRLRRVPDLHRRAKLACGTTRTRSTRAQHAFLKLVQRFVPSTDRVRRPEAVHASSNGKRLATPLFAVLVLIEATDVIFAVDSVPAVLAVSHEQFIVFASNAFAILGLRALYFLLADMHDRFRTCSRAWR